MDGGSLADVLHAAQLTGSGPLSEMVLGKLAARVLAGLNYLHRERHQVHRDMKPGNILLNSRGEVKISDFGLSAELDSTKEMCASFVGTHAYMSPERCEPSPLRGTPSHRHAAHYLSPPRGALAAGSVASLTRSPRTFGRSASRLSSARSLH